jgi:hypothetical protein
MLSYICETILFVRFVRDRGDLVNLFMSLSQRNMIKTTFVSVFVNVTFFRGIVTECLPTRVISSSGKGCLSVF